VKKEFTIVIEQDEDGIYMASVPELEGCHTQAKTLDELRERIKEAIQLYLVESDLVQEAPLNFVGIQKVEVAASSSQATCARAENNKMLLGAPAEISLSSSFSCILTAQQ
jgi:predicted RNase H-like HicB family nuclease